MCYSGRCGYETFSYFSMECGCTKPEGEPCPWEIELGEKLESECQEFRDTRNLEKNFKSCEECPLEKECSVNGRKQG